MIWCVRTNPDGSFKMAKPSPQLTSNVVLLIAWSFNDWAARDPVAAAQFADPNGHRELQHEFMSATGLGNRALVRASTVDALARYS